MDLENGVIWLGIAGLIGLFAGTLIHIISLRLPARMPVFGSSICHECSQPLPGSALIPLVSATCPSCGTTSKWHKIATELAAAALVLIALISHGITIAGLGYAIFVLFLLQVLRIDWQHHLIYTTVIVPGSTVALLFAAIESRGELISAVIAAVGAAFVFWLFYMLAILIYRRRALGRGDILLAFLIGAMARTDLVVPALLLGMLLGALGGLFLIVIGKRTRHDFIPYGAYLCAGAIIVLLLPT